MSYTKKRSPFSSGFNLFNHISTLKKEYQSWRTPFLITFGAAILLYCVVVPLGFYHGFWASWAERWNSVLAKNNAKLQLVTALQVAFNVASSLLSLVAIGAVLNVMHNMLSSVSRFTSAWHYFFRSLRVSMTLIGVLILMGIVLLPIGYALTSSAALCGDFLLGYILLAFLLLAGVGFVCYLFVYLLSLITFGTYRAYEGGEPAQAYREGLFLFKRHWTFNFALFLLSVLLLIACSIVGGLLLYAVAYFLVPTLSVGTYKTVLSGAVNEIVSKLAMVLGGVIGARYYLSIRSQVRQEAEEE